MTLATARNILAALWIVGALASGWLIHHKVDQNIFDKVCADPLNCTATAVPEHQDDEVWGWFLPLVIPYVSMIAAYFIASLAPADGRRKVNRTSFVVTASLSVIYLASLFSIIWNVPNLSEPFDISHSHDHLKELIRENVWLSSLQVLVAGSVATFYRALTE